MAKVSHLVFLLKHFLSFVLITRLAKGAILKYSDDISCLWDLKSSISDPNGYLSSWNFTNTFQGSICKFNGIDCWNENENKVLNIRLSNMGLKGQFPSGLQFCTSLTGLDLSGNSFTGSIPGNISNMIAFVTSLDLSFNSFMGEIPVNLSACQYLNAINLEHNSLTGQIPGQLITLSHLTTFSVANNLLSGPIPSFQTKFPTDSFVHNYGLCGSPLDADCGASSKNIFPNVNIGIIVASALGAVTGFWIGVFLCSFLDFLDPASRRYYYYRLRKFALYFWISRTRISHY